MQTRLTLPRAAWRLQRPICRGWEEQALGVTGEAKSAGSTGFQPCTPACLGVVGSAHTKCLGLGATPLAMDEDAQINHDSLEACEHSPSQSTHDLLLADEKTSEGGSASATSSSKRQIVPCTLQIPSKDGQDQAAKQTMLLACVKTPSHISGDREKRHAQSLTNQFPLFDGISMSAVPKMTMML